LIPIGWFEESLVEADLQFARDMCWGEIEADL
jgi:hypothetical protein